MFINIKYNNHKTHEVDLDSIYKDELLLPGDNLYTQTRFKLKFQMSKSAKVIT